MVKIASSVAIGFLLFPLFTSALPNPIVNAEGQQLAVREMEELYGRKFLLELREIHDDLDERSWASFKKGLKKLGHSVKKIANSPIGQGAIHLIEQTSGIKGRELEDMNELSARDFDNILYQREWDELDERQFENKLEERFLKEFKERVKHFGHSIKQVETGPIGQAATRAALKIMKSGGSLTGKNWKGKVYPREMEDALYGRDFEINELD
ncbi:hypothetical protein BDQ17DRAFT_1413438 [Cyathus striatus]|nr:hypothetical protein BDQ17DRAFT_1413438 [Cyathus striatus]